MKITRKQFLSTLAALGLGSATSGWPELTMATNRNLPGSSSAASTAPPYLKQGDTIAFVSPAGYTGLDDIQPAINVLKSWGFNVLVGSSIGKIWGTFGGSDQERISDMQAMLDNGTVAAIICARGGYGMVRVIDQLSFAKFRQHPKWLIGFSDITVLHSHVNKNFGIASLHSKMSSGFTEEAAQLNSAAVASMMSIKMALTGQTINYPIVPNVYNRSGSGSGIVIGGNLRTLESLIGTESEFDTTNKILLVEDVDEPLYSIDRMFWHLKRSGKLSRLAGLLVGGFSIPIDPGNDLPFAPDFYEIVLEKVRDYNYPVCFDFPIGHQEMNLAIKLGMPHQLVVADGVPKLIELV